LKLEVTATGRRRRYKWDCQWQSADSEGAAVTVTPRRPWHCDVTNSVNSASGSLRGQETTGRHLRKGAPVDIHLELAKRPGPRPVVSSNHVWQASTRWREAPLGSLHQAARLLAESSSEKVPCVAAASRATSMSPPLASHSDKNGRPSACQWVGAPSHRAQSHSGQHATVAVVVGHTVHRFSGPEPADAVGASVGAACRARVGWWIAAPPTPTWPAT